MEVISFKKEIVSTIFFLWSVDQYLFKNVDRFQVFFLCFFLPTFFSTLHLSFSHIFLSTRTAAIGASFSTFTFFTADFSAYFASYHFPLPILCLLEQYFFFISLFLRSSAKKRYVVASHKLPR